MDDSSASALEHIGIDPSVHRARQFEVWMATAADLILTASRQHRDLVITALPSAYRRTFTMKEFVRLVAEVPPTGDPAAMVAEAAARRGQVSPPEDPEDDDVRDPYRAALKHARTIAEEITDAVQSTVAALGYAAPLWGEPHIERTRAVERPLSS